MNSLDELCTWLSDNPIEQAADSREALRARLKLCARAGVFRWFVPEAYDGWQWSDRDQIEGYLKLSQSCMTTAFVLTQWNAACKRIAASENQVLRARWLPDMAAGETLATVGISHLTTSRQHVQRPVLTATAASGDGWVLEGFSPWVTAGKLADVLVVGASTGDGKQLLCAVPAGRSGVAVGEGVPLMALSASATDAVHFHRVSVQADEVIAGPQENIMHSGAGGGAGGLQTSTLAIGLTHAAVQFLMMEAVRRPDLLVVAEKLAADAQQLREELLSLASGSGEAGSWAQGTRLQIAGEPLSPAGLREQANSLVLRATQAALVAAKGAGFVSSHQAGRWCREALFFLVWSCPQSVLAANLCEFAQV